MTTDEMSAAMKAAYARVNSDDVPIATLSLRYDGLVDEQSQPTELRAFFGGGNEGYIDYEGSDIGYRDCLIEPEADIAGGQVVRFLSLPFTIEKPNQDDKGAVKAKLKIDNLNREISLNARKAIDTGKIVYLTLRGYLLGREKQYIDNAAWEFEAKNIELSGSSALIEMVTTMPNLINSKFPQNTYNTKDWPFIRNRSKKLV